MIARTLNNIVKIGAVTLAAVMVVSCVTTPAERIAENPAVFRSLPPQQQLLVQQGRIEQGMSADAVLLAWGAPDTAPVYGEKDGRRTERWIYRGYEPVTVMSDWSPLHHGPYGWYDPVYPATGTAYIPTQEAYVEFVNGKVSAWEKKGD